LYGSFLLVESRKSSESLLMVKPVLRSARASANWGWLYYIKRGSDSPANDSDLRHNYRPWKTTPNRRSELLWRGNEARS